MKEKEKMYSGETKKFLYCAPKSRKSDSREEKWSFISKKPGSASTEPTARFDLDDVWSIKKNVALNKSVQKNDQLNLNVNTNFYSRHGGLKERGETGPGLGSANPSYMSGGSSSWKTERRGFSYSRTQTPPRNNQIGPGNSNKLSETDDSPGLTDDRHNTVNGYRFGNSSKTSDPFRF